MSVVRIKALAQPAGSSDETLSSFSLKDVHIHTKNPPVFLSDAEKYSIKALGQTAAWRTVCQNPDFTILKIIRILGLNLVKVAQIGHFWTF